MRVALKGHLVLATCLILITTSRLQAQNLGAIWHFDEGAGATISDASGNGNTGCFPSIYNVSTCLGPALSPGAGDPAWSSTAAAKFGDSSLSFGSNSVVVVPDAPSLDLSTAMTLEAWFKVDVAEASGGILVAKWTISPGGQSYALGVGSCGGGMLYVAATISTDGSNDFNAVGPCNLRPGDGAWHHAAATFVSGTPGTLDVYLDGVLAGSTTAMGAGTIFGSSSPVTIGADNLPGLSGLLDGTVDEVRIWGRVLSGDEVLSSAQAGLRGDWHFDEGSGAVTADSSGYGNTGAINGAAFTGSSVAPQFFDALSLDGADDSVDVGNDSSLHVSGGDFTVEAWVEFAGLGGDMSIVDKMASSGVNTDGWRLIKQADNHFWFCLGAPGNGCQPFIGTTVRGTTVVTTGVWYHVAGVKSGNTLAIYVNGVLEANNTFASFTDTNSTDVVFGSYPLQGAFLNGEMDEVHLWARALDASEVAFLASSTARGELFVPEDVGQELGSPSGAVFSSNWHVGQTPADTNAVALAFMVPDDAGTAISGVGPAKKESTPVAGATLVGDQSSPLWSLITGVRSNTGARTLHLATTLTDDAKLGMAIQWLPQ